MGPGHHAQAVLYVREHGRGFGGEQEILKILERGAPGKTLPHQAGVAVAGVGFEVVVPVAADGAEEYILAIFANIKRRTVFYYILFNIVAQQYFKIEDLSVKKLIREEKTKWFKFLIVFIF